MVKREWIVFGAGEIGKSAIYILKLNHISVLACFDNDSGKVGQTLWGNVPCQRPIFVDKKVPVLIAVQKMEIKQEMRQQCEVLGYAYIYDINVQELYQYIRNLPDREFSELQYYLRMDGKILDLENPRTFNEKLQWLKLYDHNPRYINLVDKYEVKKYVADMIGESYIIPTLGVWDKYEDINFDDLPDKFVLKCTHDSGSAVLVWDKTSIDHKSLGSKFEKALTSNYYHAGREWVYKNIVPRIIAEKLLELPNREELKDYKLFAFHGKVRLIQVDINRFTCHKRNLYTPDWEYLPYSICYPSDPDIRVEKPECLNEMISIAEKLSEGFIHMRVDLYVWHQKVYFGELTFIHGNGTEIIQPEEFALTMGSWIEIPQLSV